MASKPEIIRTKNFVADAARWIRAEAAKSYDARGRFAIALSGGNTPRPVFGELAKKEWPWEETLLTFSDERCVPPTSPESNYHTAKEAWFDPGEVPADCIRRLRGEIDPDEAAAEYDRMLRDLAPSGTDAIFEHDLILLGLGDDGHTASLFPGSAALEEKTRGVVSNYVPKFEGPRLTFTFPMIFAADSICFLVGANKSPELLERVFAGDETLPAARASAGSRRATWIIGE